jgi:hypothetical protein
MIAHCSSKVNGAKRLNIHTMDSIAMFEVLDKAKSSDGLSLTELTSTPDLPDKYREYTSIGVGDLVTEPTKEPIAKSATGMSISKSQPATSVAGSKTVLHTHSDFLFNQTASALAAKVSIEEGTEPIGDMEKAIHVTPSLVSGASKVTSSTASTPSVSAHNSALPAIPERHHILGRQRSFEMSPKHGMSQKTELPFMKLDRLAKEFQKGTVTPGAEQSAISLFSDTAGAFATRPST